MERRGQPAGSCEATFGEAQRWLEEVTQKPFGNNDFRSALENGVLLCDLINKLKPGIIKRVNRLSTPIAGLDNVNVFLKACEKLGLNEAQLFHPGDLQDVSTRVTVRRKETYRRLKNVLITIYWLGRKAQVDPLYSGPHLNLRAFEGLLGTTLSKTLEDAGCPRSSVRDSGYGEAWFANREDVFPLQPSYRREDSVESLDSVESHTLSVTSDITLIAGSEGCGSDAEAEQGFRMSEVPAPLRRKRGDNHRGCVSPLTRSKSMGDILVDPADSQHRYQTSVTLDLCLEPVALREVRREQLRCMHIRVKESEAKWQEDLSRWKNRRRSVNLDLHRKWEKRKQMEAIMGRAGEGEEVQDHSDNEAHGKSVSTTCSSTHTLTHTRHEHTSDVVLHSRAPLARSNAVEIANFPGSCPRDLHSFEPPDKGERNQDGALPAEQASHSTCSSQCVDAMPGLPGFPWIDGTIDKTVPLTNGNPQPVSLNNHRVHWVRPVSMDCSDPQTGSSVDHGGPVDTQTDSFLQPSEDLQQQSLASVIQPRTPNYKQMGVSRLSSTLPRGFRRSEGSSRLSTGVTPRPFGAKSSAVSTLKYSKDDSHRSLLSGQKNRAPIPSFFTQTRKVITHTDLEQLSKDAEEDRVEQSKGWSSVDSGQSPVCKSRAFFPLSKAASLPDRGLGGRDRQVCYREMRISLNQRPNSSTDFGFETHWDSSGAYITFVQPGSPAELCQLQVGYEILAVSGQQVAEMSHGEWKASMADAMQKGSLLIDVRCHGNNGHPEHHISAASKPVVNGQPASSVSCEAESHSVNDAAVTFSNNGGSESAISDLQVPSISASSLSWSWDAEDERRRQEKWQREQERLLQEKYQRDQQRLEEEWQRAQQEVCGGEFGVIKDQISGEVTNGNDCPFSPSPFQSQTTPSTVVDSIQHMLEGPLEPAVESGLNEDRSPSKESDEDNRERSQWPAESYEFSMLSALDRTKSKSSPSLEAVYKQEVKGVNKDTRPQQKKKVKSLSQAEQDRQQILEEMRKRTQLFTDNSWIRQRSATVYKEPVVMGSPIRRFESLDSLEASGFGNRPSSATSFTSSNPVRPHSALGSFGPSWGPGRYSIGGVGRSSTLPASLSSGSVTESPQDRPASVPYTLEGNPIKKTLPITQHSRPVSGRRMCSYCGHSLGKGAAMVIESLGLCFHLVCFKCLACRCDLRGPESRSQVRVRHGQLFCETCYSRLRGRPIIK
ncbi:LIM domain only protein 7b isoform X2 [Denticeps clupeoides]|uniref:LIM domain only protein 7-like n=1 Tax=Denticeps clupeoides TaxID=299321 RepID=A0AAY4BP61_9TELE|nr:LIM domain only protein 7-like isoform X2 [Denticeps clupeoides]